MLSCPTTLGHGSGELQRWFRAASTATAAFMGRATNDHAATPRWQRRTPGKRWPRWWRKGAGGSDHEQVRRTCVEQQLGPAPGNRRSPAPPFGCLADSPRGPAAHCGDGAIHPLKESARWPALQDRRAPPGDSCFKQRPTRLPAIVDCARIDFGMIGTGRRDCPWSSLSDLRSTAASSAGPAAASSASRETDVRVRLGAPRWNRPSAGEHRRASGSNIARAGQSWAARSGDLRPYGDLHIDNDDQPTRSVGIAWVRPWLQAPGQSRQGIQRFGHFVAPHSMRPLVQVVLDCPAVHLKLRPGLIPLAQRIWHLRHRAVKDSSCAW